jgi:ADP-dependent NAD(P)H-hydrate dehydratase
VSDPSELTLARLAAFPLPPLPAETDKNERGRVLVVGGGAWGPGAPLLSALAALRAGAGKVQIAAAQQNAAHLAIAIPEAAVVTAAATEDGEFKMEAAALLAPLAARAHAVLVGPGMLDDQIGARLALALAREGESALVLDAGALTALPLDQPFGPQSRSIVVTPHAGEMAALLGREKGLIEADPLGAAREAAARLGAVVAMKGGTTFIVTPDGDALRHEGGAVGLATSGSGDVLAGVIAGLLARGASPLTAAAWGVCVHGAAGRRLSKSIAPVGFFARELLCEIPGLIADPLSGGVD